MASTLFEEGTIKTRDYGSANAYAQTVRKWMDTVRFNFACQHSAQLFGAMAAFQQTQQQIISLSEAQQQNNVQQPVSPVPIIRLNLTRLFNEAGALQNRQQQQIFGERTTLILHQYTVPSLMRRFIAESIDSSLLLIIKLVLVLMLVEMELINSDVFTRQLNTLESENSLSSYRMLVDFTREYFYLEMIFKVFAAFFEALCHSYGLFQYPFGCTPGKYLLRIKVVSCLDVQQINGVHNNGQLVVTVTGTPTIPFINSLIRSSLKNTITMFLFPLSLAFYLFRYNRSVYDLASKTIVVNM